MTGSRSGLAGQLTDSDAARRILWYVVLAATLGMLVWDNGYRLGTILYGPRMVNDFQVFYRAAGEADPYQIVTHITRATYRPFVSPPSLLPWIRWLALLPFNVAWALWSLGGVFFYLLAAKRFVGFPRDVIALLSVGCFEALIAGQITLFLSAALMLACSHMSRRPLFSGIIFGVIATLKPQIVVAVPFALLASREWRILLASVLTGIVVGSSCLLAQGISFWLKWLAVVQQFAAWLAKSQFVSYGLTPTDIAAMAEFGPRLTSGVFISGVTLGIGTVWHTFRYTENPQLRLGGLVVGYLLCSRYALVYEMSLVAPLAALWLLDRKAAPYCWIAGGLGIACSTILPTFGQIGAFAPPMIAIALILTVRRERLGGNPLPVGEVHAP